MKYKLPPDATPEEWKNAAWKVWKCAREHNHTIPSHWLDAMREIAIAAIEAQASVVQQEPVAWLHQCRKKPSLREVSLKKTEPSLAAKGYAARPLVFGDTHPAQQAKPQPLSEDEVWHLAKRVYARSQPYDAPQILLTAKELLTIIDCAAHGIQGS